MSQHNLTQLGKQNTTILQSPEEAQLETFENDAGDVVVPFMCNEFTSLCPVTGQPDFAKFEILYIPDQLGVESKSLKLYLFSYRNHGAFHESVTRQITDDIIEAINPKFIRVWGDFNVRGGISIKPMVIEWKKEISAEKKKEYEKMIEHWDRVRYFDF